MNYLRRNLKKRKNRVTIIVGIVSKDGIVFASDSQTSYYPGSRNRRDTDKICELAFRSGQKVLIAQSGDAAMGARSIEILKDVMLSADLDDYRKPAEMAEEAVKRLKKQVADLNGWQFGDEASIAYWEETEAALMIGYYYNQTPHIYMLSFFPGVSTRQQGYATMGCGGTVAEFILQRLKTSDIEIDNAIVSAIYTVEEVKKVDSFCGGPTKVGILFKDGESKVANQAAASGGLLKTTVDVIAKHDEKLKQEWKRIMGDIVREALEAYKPPE